MIDQSYLKSLLKYDPDEGSFIWLVDKARRSPVGSLAGSINNNGYLMISIDSKTYAAHNLAWLWMENDYPPHSDLEVDHINLNKLDNRWINLRLICFIC